MVGSARVKYGNSDLKEFNLSLVAKSYTLHSLSICRQHITKTRGHVSLALIAGLQRSPRGVATPALPGRLSTREDKKYFLGWAPKRVLYSPVAGAQFSRS